MEKSKKDDILIEVGLMDEKGKVYEKPKLEEILALETIVEASCSTTHDVC